MSDNEIYFDIVNHKKFNWYDTQAYELSRDDNKGYIYGYAQWYGHQDIDDAIDNDDGNNIQWSWFKTEQERDKDIRGERQWIKK